MSNSASEKYVMFRNYMTNELGIGKDDIKEWTEGAVKREVAKQIGQIELKRLVREELARQPYYGSKDTIGQIRSEVVQEVSKELIAKMNFKNLFTPEERKK